MRRTYRTKDDPNLDRMDGPSPYYTKDMTDEEFDVAMKAAEALLQHREVGLYGREGTDCPTADQLVTDSTGTVHGSPRWHHILSVSLDIARADRRYYGGKEGQRYCSLCRRVHQKDEFDGTDLSCRASQARRNNNWKENHEDATE